MWANCISVRTLAVSSTIRTYGRPNVCNKTGQRRSWGSIRQRGIERRNVLVGSCRISVACTPNTRALTGNSCLNRWKVEVKEKAKNLIGGVCLWWCAAKKADVEMGWQGLFPFIARQLCRVTVLSSPPSAKVMPLPAVHMTQWMSYNCLSPRRSSDQSPSINNLVLNPYYVQDSFTRKSVVDLEPSPMFATYSEAAAAFWKWRAW